MKITKLLLFLLTCLAFSCSDDDDDKGGKPAIDKKPLSLTEKNKVIQAPTALLNSNDPQAQMAAAWIQQANAMGGYFSFFDVPQGTAKSTTRIQASNGRVRDNGDYEVYVWTDDQSGYSVAYQVSEEASSYVFEIFVKEPGADWLKYFHAEEKKDQSEGFMDVYNIEGDDASTIILGYTWGRSGDNFNFTLESEGFLIELNVNDKTNVGDVSYIIDGIKQYELNWDAAGNGNWAAYDEEGNLVDEGEWIA